MLSYQLDDKFSLGSVGLESTYSAVGKGKVLFSRNDKPGMFGLGIAVKEISLAYSTQSVFDRTFYPTLICAEKAPSRGCRYMELHENMCILMFSLCFFSVVFIVDSTSILKSVCTTGYCFCLDGDFGGCVVAIIFAVVVVSFFCFVLVFCFLFIYFFICLFFCCFDQYSYLCCRCCHHCRCFCCWCHHCIFLCVVIVVVKIMFLFSIVVLLCLPYFTVHTVDK